MNNHSSSTNIQSKINNVLNNFEAICSDLQIGLPTDINDRQEQYEYYRDKLLEFAATSKPVISVSESNRGWVELIKLCQYVFGYALVPMAFLFDFRGGLYRSKNDLNAGEISYIRYLDVIHNIALRATNIRAKTKCTEKELSQFSTKYGDVFFTGVSMAQGGVGKSSVLLDRIDKCVIGGNLILARPKTHLLLPEYCAYCFSTYEFEKYIVLNRKNAVMELLNTYALASYLLPLPSIATQKRIASFLNTFTELTTELNARKKQFEYYRDQLLTFDDKNPIVNEGGSN